MITLQRVDCNRESPPNLTVEYMTTKSIEFATISEIGALIRSNELSSVALTTLMLDRIERLDGRLNAFITVTSELALKQAAESEAAIVRLVTQAAQGGGQSLSSPSTDPNRLLDIFV